MAEVAESHDSAATEQPSPAEQNFDPSSLVGKTIHSAYCDACGKYPIVGVRWRCIDCPDEDLCNDCKAAGKISDHNFRPIHIGNAYVCGNCSRIHPIENILSDAQDPTARHLKNNYSSYEKLNPEKREIRLVSVLPGERDDPIYCIAAKIPSPWNRCPYQALSYCWGDIYDTKFIALSHIKWKDDDQPGDIGHIGDAEPFRITASLEAALRALRLTKEESTQENRQVWFWIDALSINQGDMEERHNQVAIMRDIYSEAWGVYIWLGTDPNNADSLIMMYGILGAARAAFGDDADLSSLNQKQFDSLSTLTGTVGGVQINPATIMAALSKFFSNPWFKRVWVVQEVFNSKRGRVACGHEGSLLFLTWEMLALAHQFFLRMFVEAPSKNYEKMPDLWKSIQTGITSPESSTQDLQSCTQSRPRLELLELFRKVCWDFHATDPRDKIFALLGLARETVNGIPPALSPRYDLSASEVFTNFTRWCILQYRNLDVLSAVNETARVTCANLCCNPGPFGNPDHPTWALWHVGKSGWARGNLTEVRPFQIATHRSIDIALIDALQDPTILSLRGICIGTIKVLNCFPFRKGFITEDVVNMNELQIFEPVTGDYQRGAFPGIWGYLSGPSSEFLELSGSESLYHTDEDLFEAYLETLMCMPEKPALPLEESSFGRNAVVGKRLWEDPDFATQLVSYWKEQEIDPDMQSIPMRVRKYLETFVDKMIPHLVFLFSSQFQCCGRCFFISTEGQLGLCPPSTRVDDVIVALWGGRVPFVLRPREAGKNGDEPGVGGWEFVGECYLHGRMEGNSVDERLAAGVSEQVFDIR
ncbi:hypothetical protein K490DRAFT_63263 [Saccharata proteae CBS 121410]|uniref:ZZ-type domain-containing protein n=1 Tax=Saccharata proteae CBS 121410 TaxID=1314787 RepID=A0A9P4HZM5_9PEZI|nr:hypothetical protein K490DRAFT_63263 [Saccharata proteae CBS 121410]